jgi:hypothetical protein
MRDVSAPAEDGQNRLKRVADGLVTRWLRPPLNVATKGRRFYPLSTHI